MRLGAACGDEPVLLAVLPAVPLYAAAAGRCRSGGTGHHWGKNSMGGGRLAVARSAGRRRGIRARLSGVDLVGEAGWAGAAAIRPGGRSVGGPHAEGRSTV